MKGFDLELNDLFDIEGFLAFIILVITTFLIYYSAAFPDVSNRHEESVVEPVNVTEPATLETLKLIYPPTSEDGEEKTGELKLLLRVPKYVASFNDTTMELTISNPLEIKQSGRFYIEDEIRPLTGETNFKHISFSIDGKKTNQSDFSIPPYARQTFTVTLNAPRNIEGNIVTLRLGLLGCNDNDVCNQYGETQFLGWTKNNSCKTTDAKKTTSTENELPAEFICISINTAQAIQFSAREQILLSPWSNIFLPAFVFLVTYIVDHTFLRKIHSRSINQKFQTGRFWKLLIISAVIIFIILFLLIKNDIVLALVIVIPTILLIILAHTIPLIRCRGSKNWCKVCGQKLEAKNHGQAEANNNDSGTVFKKSWKTLTTLVRSESSHYTFFAEETEKLHEEIKNYDESSQVEIKIAWVDGIVSMIADICEKRRRCMECDEISNQEACSLEIKRINEQIYLKLPDILKLLDLPLRYKLVSAFLVLDPQNYIYQVVTEDQFKELSLEFITEEKGEESSLGVETNLRDEGKPSSSIGDVVEKPDDNQSE